MDYKKILAATAVTSAAIVVPVVAQAEDTIPTNEGLVTGTYKVGETIQAGKLMIDDVEMPIATYEWFIDDTKASSTTHELKIPITAVGKTIKLIVTTVDGKTTHKYQDSLVVESFPIVKTVFKEVGLEETKTITEANVETTIQATGYEVPDKIGDTNTNQYVTGFQWYVKNGGKYELLSGETDEELDVPFKLQGKDLVFVISTNLGNYYESSVTVNTIEVGEDPIDFELKINGKKTTNTTDKNSDSLVPGDVLSVDKLTIKDLTDKLIPPTQYDVKYQWYSVNEKGTVVLLKNATGASFTIPTSTQAGLTYRVDITANVSILNQPKVKTAFFTGNLDTNLEIQNLISKLLENNQYSTGNISLQDVDGDFVTEFAKFSAYVNALNSLYNELAPNRKQFVKNYAILQQATIDVQAYSKFYSQLQQFEAYREAYNATTGEVSKTKHSELMKKFATLKSAYSKLTAKQKSMYSLESDHDITLSVYMATMQEWLNKSNPSNSTGSDSDYITFNAIQKLNEGILALLDDTISDGSDYLNKSKYVLPNVEKDPIAAFIAQVKQLTDEIKKIDKMQQSLIYTSILKTAQSDAKKAQVVVEKIQKIETLTDKKKKASAFVAAQKAFDKLTTLQTSLVWNYSELTLDEEPTESTPNFEVQDLVDRIEALQPYTNSDVKTLKEDIEEIAAEYKFLSSADRKLVINYKLVNTVKKDVSAAEKVVKAFDAATAIEEEALSISADNPKAIVSKLKSAKSKYLSAYKMYIKLTPTVRELVLISLVVVAEDGKSDPFVGDIDTLIKEIDKEIERYNTKDPVASTGDVSPEKIVEEINSLEQDITSASGITIEGATTIINDLKAKYKKLNTTEKKLVYNYSTISVMNTHVTKAKSAEKKIQAALGTSNLSKLNSAKKTYEKLPTPQQKLLSSLFTQLDDEMKEIQGNLPDESTFAVFIAIEGKFNYDYETIAEAVEDIKAFSTKELKAIANYKEYEVALKDKKAVDSFVDKLKKLGKNPTYSKKQSILSSFNKLTSNQSRLFLTIDDGVTFGMETSPVEMLESWVNDLTSKTDELNRFIGELFVEGVYKKENMNATSLTGDLYAIGEVKGEGISFIESFNTLLTNIEAAYKKLDSKEKKLVTHYKMISEMKKDLKAVTVVVKLANDVELATTDKKTAYEKYETAYNKLTAQQQSLFNLAITTQPTLD